MAPGNMKRTVVLFLLCGCLLTAEARWTDALPQITKDDLALIEATARVKMTDKPIGTTLTWSNSKTGYSGTVTLLENFEHKRRKCRTNRHVITQQAMSPKTYVISICQNSDGTWQVLPQSQRK
jgi:surface antigen